MWIERGQFHSTKGKVLTMTEPAPYLHSVDCETMYQGKTPLGKTMPWDINEPQPSLVELEKSGGIKGDVLDIGCGTGDNAIYLASRGYRVVGVDVAPTAVEEARQRAQAHGFDVTFEVADATKLDGYDQDFDTIIDSALYHSLEVDERESYVAALHRVARPGARLHILCFSDRTPEEFPDLFRITEENLRTTIARYGTITSLTRHEYTSSMNRKSFRQFVRLLTNVELDDEALSRVPLDDSGRVRLPIWRLTATRD